MEPLSVALLALIAVAAAAWLGVVALATPTVAYRIDRRYDVGSREFADAVTAALSTRIVGGNRLTRLDNGERFYPEMLAAIAAAHRSISLECYIFHPGQIGDAFTEALVERAIAGVQVRIIVDAIGSRKLRRRQAMRLTRAGCELAWHPRARWRRAHRLTNSTHRELLVVDGRIAFTGGAGISDWWAIEHRGQPPWRDTMVRVEGPVVAACQAVFAENWLECRGDIMAGEAWFPPLEACGSTDAAVIRNSLSFAGSRALFQALIQCATREIRLATPYFVPDPSFMSALIERARHGVSITILLPGRRMDHPWVRLSSRRLFRPLLDAGIRLFEYQPTMTHQKLMIVDGLWTVVGTTNLDMLSFEYLDELNLAVRDAGFSQDARHQYERDLEQCVEVQRSAHRPAWEKSLAWIVWTLAGQRWIVGLRRHRAARRKPSPSADR